MEHKIGERITMEDGRVVEVVSGCNCDLCAFGDSDIPCDPHRCSGTLRKDHKNIIYKEIEEG